MEDASRASSRHSKSVVFPRIDRNSPEKTNARDNPGTSGESQPSRPGHSQKSPRNSQDNTKSLLARLEFTERALEEERRGRILLDDNLRSIVINVQRLSKDFALLQHQVKTDETTVQSQNAAMKNLELHQMAGIGDIWNRLTLGDLNSIKLAGDLNKVAGEISDLKRSDEDVRRRLNSLQNTMDSIVTKLEKVNLDFEKNLQVLKVKQETQNQSIDEKIKHMHEQYEGFKLPSVREKVDEEHFSKLVENMEQRLDAWSESNQTWQTAFEGRVGKLEERLSVLLETKSKKDEAIVRRIQEVSDKQYSAFKKSHEKQHSNREAFKAVYESITTMQTVLETKLKVTEADLKASINSITRTIANS